MITLTELQRREFVLQFGKRGIKPVRIEVGMDQVETMFVTPSVGVIIERQPGFDVVTVDVLSDLLETGQPLPVFTIHAAVI